MDIKMKNNKRYFISFTVILSIVMFSFISSVAVFASENIFTDGTELDSYENKKTNLYNVDNTANENDFISEIEESEMSKTVLNEENIDPKELHAFNYNYINGIMNASDVSLYSDVWAIIPTTSGSKTVYSTATVPGASSYYVRLLQACLNYLGYNSGSADGIYGTKTKSAIKSFQRNNGLTVDGIAGEMTWRYIDIRVDTYFETHGKVPF